MEQPLGSESVPLVSHLFEDFLLTNEKLQEEQNKHETLASEYR